MIKKDYPVLVSIIIPTFNRSALLAETLKSVEQQTFKEWECIVVDDGSDDDTATIVKEVISRDERFKFYRRARYPKGACGSRNFGLDQSRGKYIQWLDDDDLLSKNKLDYQVNHLERLNNPRIFTTCSWDVFWENKVFEERNLLNNNHNLGKEVFFKKLAENQSFIPSNAYLTPRRLIDLSGVWNTQLKINQDAEFFCRVLLQAEKLINTPDCYVLYRIHQGERISAGYDSTRLKSLLYSYRLIHAHLKAHSVENRDYFKWKLLKIFLTFWESDRTIIENNKYFFAENGIKVGRFKYYSAKAKIYKMIFPFYKKYFKNKN